MKTYINKTFLICILILLTAIISCSKMDEYKDYIKDGEISYTGKIDSVLVLTGDGKVIITGLFMSDPKVVKCRVYWDNKNDSVDIPVKKTHGVDTLYHPIMLPEGFYNFEIYTYDKLDNRSIVVYANGESYGDLYKASISNRFIKSAIQIDGVTTIEWSNIDPTLGAFQTQLNYTDNEGIMKNYKVQISDKQTILSDHKAGTQLNYDTWYRPDTLCVDTFRTAMATLDVTMKIDKSAWTITTDSEELEGEGPINGRAICAIDDDVNTFWHTKHPGRGDTPFPHYLLIDMHQTVDVKSFQLTPRQNNDQGITDFEIYGSLDGVSWVKYGPFKLNAQTNDTQGFTLAGALPMRYFKFNATNGRNGQYTHLGELTIFGIQQ